MIDRLTPEERAELDELNRWMAKTPDVTHAGNGDWRLDEDVAVIMRKGQRIRELEAKEAGL